MIFGCFRVSDMVAKGIVQLSTGPQKCVLKVGKKGEKSSGSFFINYLRTYVYIYNINVDWMRGWYLCARSKGSILRRRREKERETKRKMGRVRGNSRILRLHKRDGNNFFRGISVGNKDFTTRLDPSLSFSFYSLHFCLLLFKSFFLGQCKRRVRIAWLINREIN